MIESLLTGLVRALVTLFMVFLALYLVDHFCHTHLVSLLIGAIRSAFSAMISLVK